MTSKVNLLPVPHADLALQQDNPHWLQMWKDDRIAEFHHGVVNSLLEQCWSELVLTAGNRILVPLCGKSLDMLWLAKQGYQVIGIEISPIAVKAFFHENKLKAKKSRVGNFICWQSDKITIWCGDFFALRKQQIGKIDAVFDNTALTALPEELRSRYVSQLLTLVSNEVDIFLLTIEDVVKQSGLAVEHIDHEIQALYKKHFDISLLYVQRMATTTEDECYVDKKVYKMTKKHHQVRVPNPFPA